MPHRTGSSDPNVIKTIRELRKKSNEQKVEIWRRVSEIIDKPRRSRVEVNISRINRHTKPRDVVVVPGKVLASGELDHEVSIGALSFSRAAKEKIEKAKGKVLTIGDIVAKNPKGTKVMLMK
jgi:large subunit ribosomal protein L18e